MAARDGVPRPCGMRLCRARQGDLRGADVQVVTASRDGRVVLCLRRGGIVECVLRDGRFGARARR